MKRLYSSIIFLLALSITPTAFAQVNLHQINTAYQQVFDSLASAGATNGVSTLPKGWSFIENGTNADTTYATGFGSGTAGNTYSFGATGSTERALGGLQSGSLIPIIGARFVNNTGSTVTSLIISYRGEQWRLGASARGIDRLDFQYSLDATAINNGNWNHVDQLDFNSPVNAGTVGALVGNNSPNNTDISFEITGLNIENGASFAIRWTDFNITSSDDALAIDNFSLTPVGVPSNQPNISFVPDVLNFGDVNINTNATRQYEVVGANLIDSITTVISVPYLAISLNGVDFTNVVKLPPSGGFVYVRFSPTSNGAISDSVHHMSNPVVASVMISGFGFEQASNIIPIATARTKSIGAKVTVAGRITVANEHGNPAFVQDGTGGIPVFDSFLASHVEIGDSVIVTGPIGVFNDQIQISGAGIFFTLADSTNRYVTPKPISISELAANEGLLVTVQGVELVNKSFVFYPQSTERMTNGTTQADLRIDGDTNIPGLTKPQGTTDITGVVGRFRTNAQLLPRFREDIPGVAEPSSPSDSIPKSLTFDVVNWNLEFFGATREDYPEEYGPADEALQLQNVKRVMDELNADVFAVQEVSEDSLFAELVRQLGHGQYNFTCSDRFSYSFQGPSSDFPPQKVCFIYDTTTVSITSARPLFESLYDSARTINPSMLPGIPGGNPSSFYSSGRLPYLATFNVTIGGVTETVKLITIHAKSGSTADDRNRRLYDATVLKDSLDAHYTQDQVIILGDLNDDLDQSITVGQASPYAAFVTDTAYVSVTKALSDAGARSTVSFNDVIDHQIITSELQEEFINGSQRIFTPFQLIPNYGNTTTDHLAVMTRYAFIAPEVNFVQQTAIVTEDSTTLVIDVTLSKSVLSNTDITILVSGNATAGADYITNELSGNVFNVTIPAGQTSANFTVTVVNDNLDEVEETALFSIQSRDGISVGSNSDFALTIQDNDIPTISFTEYLASAEEGSGEFTVKLKLSTPPATDQTASILVRNGFKVDETDYTTSPTVNNHIITVNIPAGSEEGSFTITPLTDRKNEPLPEIVTFFLQGASDGLTLSNPRLSFFSIINVKKKHQLTQLVVSPNPTSGNVRLSFDDGEFDGNLSVELRSDNGKLIYRGNGTLDQLSDALSSKLRHERRGIYVLNVTQDDESRALRILKKD